MRTSMQVHARRPRRTATRLASLLLLALGASCDGAPTGDTAPRPGELVIALRSPHADDAAVFFTLEGDGIEQVLAVNVADALFARSASPGRTNIVVAAEALDGDLARFAVPDVRNAARYRATVVEVADTRNRTRESLDGYALEIRAAEQ